MYMLYVYVCVYVYVYVICICICICYMYMYMYMLYVYVYTVYVAWWIMLNRRFPPTSHSFAEPQGLAGCWAFARRSGAIFGLNAEGLAVARALHMAKARKQRGRGSGQIKGRVWFSYVQLKSMGIPGSWNGGTVPYKAIFWGYIPLHRPYIW